MRNRITTVLKMSDVPKLVVVLSSKFADTHDLDDNRPTSLGVSDIKHVVDLVLSQFHLNQLQLLYCKA